MAAEARVRGLGRSATKRAIISWLYQSEYWTACGGGRCSPAGEVQVEREEDI